MLLFLLCSCSFFSRTKNEIYTLDRIAGAKVAARGTPIGIESIELPPGFDRREIVVRSANQQLDVRSNQLWSSGFKELVLHTLAFDLAARLPEGMIVLPGETKPAAVRPVDVIFEDLSAGPDSKVTLDARWTLDHVAHHETIAVAIPSLDSSNVAMGTAQALGQLADRIAAAR